jgi:hypothetical protein
MGEKRNSFRLLVGKPEGKRPLGIPRHRWVYNIKTNLGEIVCGEGHNKHNKPPGSINCWEFLGWLHNWWPLE